MKLIDKAYDEILKCGYELYSIKFKDLILLVRDWYGTEDFSEFDKRTEVDEWGEGLEVIKETGIVSNYFYAYREDTKCYLLDGFNRLLTNYSVLDSNPIVYLKVINTKIKDHELMRIMCYLNMWKLGSLKNFFDRGMRLFLNSKFNIDINDNKQWFNTGLNGDLSNIGNYFQIDNNMWDCGSGERYGHDDTMKLISGKMIIKDIKQILSIKRYIREKEPWEHYHKFLDAFFRFLSRRRLYDDLIDYKFEDLLNRLYEDKKFFEKLKGMSWRDTTRQNIVKWFNKIEEELNKK